MNTFASAAADSVASASPGALSGRTAIVVGASRGLGRGIAETFAHAGAQVIGVSRTSPAIARAEDRSKHIRSEIADGCDPAVAASLIDRYDPDIVVLVAGATPHMRAIQQHTWETFSLHWQSDVRMVFHWIREILLNPLKAGSRVIVFSSGAAVGGSPLSGGYAGSKATQRFIATYAQDEAKRAGLDIAFTSVLPRFARDTGVGDPAIQAYAKRAGLTVENYLRNYLQSAPPLLTASIAGDAMLELVRMEPVTLAPAYTLTGDGLRASV